MLRIETIRNPEETVLRISGTLQGEDVGLLAREGKRHFAAAGRMVLDLRGVQFIDSAGIRLLQGWSHQDLTLRGASLFIRTLLSMNQVPCAPEPQEGRGDDV